MGFLRYASLIFTLLFSVYAHARTHASPHANHGNPPNPSAKTWPRSETPVRHKPPGADAAPLQVILNHDRCKPGKFKFPGGSCEILGRGETSFDPKMANNTMYDHGKTPDGRTCYYLREQFNKGATPIPSNGMYTLKFRGFEMGTNSHWASAKPDKRWAAITKAKQPGYIPAPIYEMGLAGGAIPPSRQISSLLMHPHGLSLEDSPVWAAETHGCLKISTACIRKLYDWTAKQKIARINLAIWEK